MVRIRVSTIPVFLVSVLLVPGFPVSAFCGAVAFAQNSAPRAVEHPRLFHLDARIEQVRGAVAVRGSHHARALSAMRERVAAGSWRVYDERPDDGNRNYARSWRAREAAFLYQLTGEAVFADAAYEALRLMYEQPDPDGRLADRGYGLSRAMVGVGLALAYDWAYSGWTEKERRWVRARIEEALDAWPDYRHANIETDHLASNWVAVCRGGELLMMLAIGAEEARAERFRFLKDALRTHLENGYGPTGWSQEGIGYVSYAGQFLLPAVFALESLGDSTLTAAMPEYPFYRLPMAAGALVPDRLTLMSGVDDGTALGHQGWASLLLRAVPDEHRGAYRYFYDRFMGICHPRPPGEKFDPERAGTAWALLFYPGSFRGGSPGFDPAPSGSRAGREGVRGGRCETPRVERSALPRTLFDRERGAYYFRSGWRSGRGVLVSLMGDYAHHGHAWDAAEAFQLNVLTDGTRFAGGPGKAGAGSDPDPTAFSTLLVDGRIVEEGAWTGRPVSASANEEGGGYVIVDGGPKYEALGVERARRHLRVDPTDAGPVLFSTLDRVRSDSVRRYAWQVDHGPPGDPSSITVTTGLRADVPTFTLRGPELREASDASGESEKDGGSRASYLKAWVLGPEDVRVVAGDPLRVISEARSTAIWIVAVTGRGAAPEARIEHVSPAGARSVRILGRTYILQEEPSWRIVSPSSDS